MSREFRARVAAIAAGPGRVGSGQVGLGLGLGLILILILILGLIVLPGLPAVSPCSREVALRKQ